MRVSEGEATEIKQRPGVARTEAARVWLRRLDWSVALVGSAALGLVVVLLVAVWQFAEPLALLLAAIAISEALAPLVSRLERWLPRVAAVLLLYFVLVLLLVGIGALVVPAIVTQAQAAAESLPESIEVVRDRFRRWSPIEEVALFETFQSEVGRYFEALARVPLVIVASGFQLVSIVIFSIYWLLVGPQLLRFTRSLFPEQQRAQVEGVLREMGETMGGYIRGTALVATIVGLLAYAGLRLIGVSYPLVLALIAGLLEIIPILGPIIAGVPIVGTALLDSPTTGLIVLVFWIAVQQLESYVLSPQLIHRQADIPPLLVLLALLAGGSVGGVLGALIAIPVAGALRVFALRVLVPPIRRWTGAAEDAAESSSPGSDEGDREERQGES